MEFLKTVRKRRSLLSEIVYVVLNIGLAVALMLIVRMTGSFWLALALVLLSKWRVLAVRPRFWFANVQADLVSFIVSVSFIVFLYNANPANVGDTQSIVAQSIFTVLYIVWLLFLKPQSKRLYIAAQAGVALFTGITAIYSVAYGWMASPVILLMWLVGYASARHILNNYDNEDHVMLLSLVWGLISAEIGWIAFHWTIAYRLPILANVLLPRVSIAMLCFGLIAYKAYDSYYHHQKIRISDILLPLVFTVLLIGWLVLFRNSISAII